MNSTGVILTVLGLLGLLNTAFQAFTKYNLHDGHDQSVFAAGIGISAILLAVGLGKLKPPGNPTDAP